MEQQEKKQSHLELNPNPTSSTQTSAARTEGRGEFVTMEELRAVFKDTEKKILEAKQEALEEINKQVEATQTFYLMVFGIFASIISILTIQFQVLATCKNILDICHIAGLIMLLIASWLGFVLALDYLAKSKSQCRFIMLCVLTIVLFVTGIKLILP